MAALFETNFVGTGPMEEFVAEVVKALRLLNNINLVVGPGYTGDPIQFGVRKSGDGYSLELNLNNVTNIESR